MPIWFWSSWLQSQVLLTRQPSVVCIHTWVCVSACGHTLLELGFIIFLLYRRGNKGTQRLIKELDPGHAAGGCKGRIRPWALSCTYSDHGAPHRTPRGLSVQSLALPWLARGERHSPLCLRESSKVSLFTKSPAEQSLSTISAPILPPSDISSHFQTCIESRWNIAL